MCRDQLVSHHDERPTRRSFLRGQAQARETVVCSWITTVEGGSETHLKKFMAVAAREDDGPRTALRMKRMAWGASRPRRGLRSG